ncbi:hypothetical protein LWI29_037551 [Acer saccharum]|uniref:DNA/RNA-binding protein Alba-like domain-containing protein n=2 Tax=Acer TaxID=4022 RepID=A0AA39S716_ACESA|nr:hypothetical protein LWI29_037551 [Acer saccharum]
MDRYHKVEKPKPDSPINENEIRITSQGAIRNYITYASTLLQEKRVKEIVLKAMGQAINKTVAIAEIIKKRIPRLHQDTAISSVSITDVWEPIEEGLVPVEMTRHVSMISITLSATELNNNSPGYQAPQYVEQPKPQYRYQQHQHQHQHPRPHPHPHPHQHQHQHLHPHQLQPPRQGRISYNAVNDDSYSWGRGRGRGRGRSYGKGGYGNYGNYQENDGYSSWGRGGVRGRGWGYRPGYERGRGGGGEVMGVVVEGWMAAQGVVEGKISKDQGKSWPQHNHSFEIYEIQLREGIA